MSAEATVPPIGGRGSPGAQPTIRPPGPPANESSPATIGRYTIVRKLGSGAMGVVWLAHDPDLDRNVAIKILPPAYAKDADFVKRFLREARLAAKLHHPNAVTVHDVGADAEQTYIVMELVEGGSLDLAIAGEQPMDWRDATRAIRDAAAGLAAAHELGLVHRDIKPENLMRTVNGVTKVVDFGLARSQLAETRYTQQGMLLGTPAYMAPELWVGGEADARSDLYALVLTYFHLLTGELPFTADQIVQVGHQHVHAPLPDPRIYVPKLPDEVCRILLRGAAKEAANRHTNAAELAADLDALLAMPQKAHSFGTSWKALCRSASTQHGRRPANGRRFRWIAAMAAGAAALSGVIFYVATDFGEVKIQLSDPAAKVEVKVDGNTIDIAGLREPLRVKSGPHDLEVSSGEFQAFTKAFTVKRGEREVVRVTLEPKPRPAAVSDATRVTSVAPVDRATHEPKLIPIPSTGTATLGKPKDSAIGASSLVKTASVDRASPESKPGPIPPTGTATTGVGSVEKPKDALSGASSLKTASSMDRATVGPKPGPIGMTDTLSQGKPKNTSQSASAVKTAESMDRTRPAPEPRPITPRRDAPVDKPKETPKSATYRITLRPADARLTASGQRITVSGNGPDWTVTLAEPDGQKALLVAVKAGYKTLEQEIQPKPGESRHLTLELEVFREPVITNSVGMKLILIPSGEFKMGSGESADDMIAFFNSKYALGASAEKYRDEHPQHRVRITKPFYLGAMHVTRGQFRKFVDESGFKTDAEKDGKGGSGYDETRKKLSQGPDYSWRNAGFTQTDEHPVVNVSWNDAVAYCRWLNRKEGKEYRLPTEAEWEYACRAGTTTRYWCGSDPEALATVGNVADAAARAEFPDWTWTIKANDGYVFTSPVGSFRPNPFGLYDMHGNAWQWCGDWYAREYYTFSPVDDPPGPSSGSSRVLRGGSTSGRPNLARSANRNAHPPDSRFYFTGFRVLRTP
jgi:formylglycine-generating enzyme